MDAVSSNGNLVRFGPFELDARRAELRKNGVKLKIQDQPYRALLMLLDRQGEIVSREDLRKALWDVDTFVDFDHSLNAAMNRLRDILRDSASNPRFIETVPRRGYRFIAQIERPDDAPAPVAEMPAPELPPIQVVPPRRPYFTWAAAAFAGIAAVTGFFFLRQARGLQGITTRVPLTTYPGVEFDPTFSPDGSQVAFAWTGREDARNLDIFVKVVGEDNPQRLTTSPESDDCPAWSPDGRYIAFARWHPGSGMEYVLIPPLGGTEQKLLQSKELATQRLYGRCISWMPDGRSVILIARDAEDQPDRLYWLSLDSRERRPVTSPPAGIPGDAAVAVSPDGKYVVFSRVLAYGNSDLYILCLTSDGRPDGQPRRLTADSGVEMDPAWTADSKSIIYAGGPSSFNTRLWKITPSGSQQPLEFAHADSGARGLTFARRGARLAYAIKKHSANIWRYNLAGHTAPTPEPLIASNSLNQMPEYSPDGRMIAFESTRTGAREIWLATADSANVAPLTRFGVDSGCPRWSPDGKEIAFFSNQTGNREIYVMNVESRTSRRITNHPADDAEPAWSRDGKWIYFTTDRTGHKTIWKASSRGGQASQVTNGAEFGIRESTDGDSLYYTRKANSHGSALWSLPTSGGPETQVLDSLVRRNTAVVDDGVYFIPALDSHTIKFRDFKSGRTRDILTMKGYPAWGLAVSPDHHTLLFSQEDESSADLMLVEGAE